MAIMTKKEMKGKTLAECIREQLARDGKNGSTADEICNAIIIQAKSGNVKAFETIRDTIGEKPTENIYAQIETPTFVEDVEK